MATTTVSLNDLGKWPVEVIAKSSHLMLCALQQSVSLHGPRLVQQSVDAVRPHKPVSTGVYRAGWRVEKLVDGAALMNGVLYAGIIEHGRRPGKGVSKEGQEAIARWVHLHGMDQWDDNQGMRRKLKRTKRDRASKRLLKDKQESRARGIAFLIARAIKRRGLPAKNVLGSCRGVLTEQVVEDVRGALDRGSL